ncbi:heat shock protein DnaJ domain protein [Thermodesulfatator indicus DSM 15286]|uniref:Heat shock protein DnaJ domain protein n=1 Tax=Thermodesulfatator indicus (strain DSM 15286 / JCM 11887 / CIR29812) TaxID=667014 RepID=F8A8W0_THEID|nr:molecular chaperone DnaJ [Thermodesulfatator indicus]AEH44007.1 heat shock protein DnaJ domain protein [Thermodesulfatator indicus DSM 15286]
MYLARQKRGKYTYFFLRESYFADGLWRSRDLIALGRDPSRFIVYPGGNSFYIKEEIIESLAEKGVKTDQWELEKIFWPFVDPHIRRVIENFSAHQVVKRNRLSAREQLALQQKYHIFDCRRLLFLKFGGTEVDFLLKRPLGFLNVLYQKSRDEIEQYIMVAEEKLRPRETLAYIYTSFGLAKHFPNRLSRYMPEAQAMEKIDEAFLCELCLLLEDEKYLMGLEPNQVLKEYLSRYVIMYFDRLAQERRFFEEREARLLEKRRADLYHVAHEAAGLFGLSPEKIIRLNKDELSTLFRRKARELHPDQGGEHEAFIKLRKLYEELMKLQGYQRLI